MSWLRESLGRASTASQVCAAALVAGVVATYVLSLLTPALLAHHALLLEALSGNVASVVVGGALASAGRQSLPLVLLAPLLGVVLYDVALWWAGRLWGNGVLSRFVRTPRARRRLARTEGWVARRGVLVLAVAYFLPLPNPATYLLCGASGMPIVVFVLGDVIGTLLWTGVLAALGWVVGRPALRLLQAVDHYALGVTVAVVIVVVAVNRHRARRQPGFSPARPARAAVRHHRPHQPWTPTSVTTSGTTDRPGATSATTGVTMSASADAARVAEQLPAVLARRDRVVFERLLSPDVRWGGREDTEQTCHDRGQAGDFYAAMLEGGARLEVLGSAVVDGEKVLARLEVTASDRDPSMTYRTDVLLTIRGGLVTEILDVEDDPDVLPCPATPR